MSAPPYMKLYVADYLGDTHHLSALEHGAYLLLLMGMWRAGGTLPAADGNLCRLARCTPDEWAQIKGTVLAFFKQSRGKLTHKRLGAEMAKYENTSRIRSEAGKKGAAKKTLENSGEAEAFALHPESNSRHNQNHNHKKNTPLAPKGADEGKAKPEGVTDAQVEAVWGIAPPESRRRSSKADLRRSLISAVRRGRAVDEITAGLRAYFASPEATKDGGAYVKGVHRMVEQDRWTSFADATPLAPSVSAVAFDGPAALRERLVAATSEDFARSFVDHAHWDQATRTLVAKTSVAAERITQECEEVLRRVDVRVIPPGAKLPPPAATRAPPPGPAQLPLQQAGAR